MNHSVLLSAVLVLTACDSSSTTTGSATKDTSSAGSSAKRAEQKSSAASSAGASAAPSPATAATTAVPAEPPPPAVSASATATADDEQTGTGVGFDSPEALAKAIVDTLNAPTPEKIRALFPTRQLIEKLVTCKEGNSLGKEVTRDLTKMVKKLDKPIKEAPITFVSSETKLDKAFSKGDTHKDCTINEAFVAHKLKITGKDKDGKEDGDKFGALEYDKKWYLVDD